MVVLPARSGGAGGLRVDTLEDGCVKHLLVGTRIRFTVTIRDDGELGGVFATEEGYDVRTDNNPNCFGAVPQRKKRLAPSPIPEDNSGDWYCMGVGVMVWPAAYLVCVAGSFFIFSA